VTAFYQRYDREAALVRKDRTFVRVSMVAVSLSARATTSPRYFMAVIQIHFGKQEGSRGAQAK